ncbi:MAG: hypothetical protein QM752_04240 [Gammaproteobacteria bacterium]
MHDFFQTAVKLLTSYKTLVRRQLSHPESTEQLAQLGLHKRLPTRESDLYHLCVKVMHKLYEEVENLSLGGKYSGFDQFLDHMRTSLSCYHLDNDRVIHIAQKVSKVMLEAIQLMPKVTIQLTDQLADKLEFCSSYVAQHGLPEQKKAFLNSLHSHSSRNSHFFQPLLDNFQKTLSAS